MYPLILGPCLPALRAQLEGTKGYETIDKELDLIELLKLIRGLYCCHDLNNDKTYAVISSLKNLLYLYQKPEDTNNEYLKELKARVESMDDYRACMLRKFPCLIEDKMMKKFNKTMDKATQKEIEECEKAGKRRLWQLYIFIWWTR